jgi:hypothetical protein
VTDVAKALRSALESGDFSGLTELYADDARLEASLQGSRTIVHGPEEAEQELQRIWPTPGRLLEYTPSAGEHGLAVWLERSGENGDAHRQRHYLHESDGQITAHWIYAAPPGHPDVVPADESGPQAPPELFEPLGLRPREQEVVVSTGWSGNRIERAVMDDGRSLICKRIVPEGGWLERLGEDQGREGMLHAEGVFQRFPTEVDPTVIASFFDGSVWWIAMRDVSEYLFGMEGPISREQNQQVLKCANSMWETFWGERLPMLGRLERRLPFLEPKVGEQERDQPDFLPKQLEAAWEAFAEVVDNDVAEAVLATFDDPATFAAEIKKHGTTLIHGDLRDEQIGLDGDRLVAVDWGGATQGHPVVELGWYMMHDVWRIEATHDEVVEDFRRARGEADDPAALDLGMISGLAMYGWILGHSAVIHTDEAERAWAREELDWWVPRVRLALETWSPL